MKHKIDNYIDGFTVHGLTRVFKSPRHEAIFWLMVLIVGLALAVFVLYTLIKKYYEFEIYTEIKSVLTEKNAFPSFSICEMSMLTNYYFLYCGSPMSSPGSNTNACDRSKIPVFDDVKIPSEGSTWTNGVFDVVYCAGWGKGNCNLNQEFKTHPLINHSCITWNHNGNISDSYGHVEMTVIFRGQPIKRKKPKVIVIPHDSRIVEIDLTKKVSVDPKKSYEIKVQKTLIKRLPNPYPSKCVSEEEAKTLDITPGAYSRRTCLESFQTLHAVKECGATFDYMQQFLPEDFAEKYAKNNKTVLDTKKCIGQSINQGKPDKDDCPFPCEELDLGITSTFNEFDTEYQEDYVYHINIQLQSIDSYSVMEEKPLYSADQLTCEIGGFLGLVMGASLLSFIEIIFCSTLMVAKKWYAKHQS